MKKSFLGCSILFAVITLRSTALYAAPLTGTKTIGGTSPDYASFTTAVADLNLNGVGTGGVTFVLRSGTYGGGVTITAVGTLANPIVFQSDNLDATTVIINSAGSADAVTLQGSSYLTFRAITIQYTGLSGYNAVQLGTNADFVTITDCILEASNITSTAFSSSVVYASESLAANDCDNFVLSNCTLRYGSYGIYFGMSTSQPTGIQIEGNHFEGAYGGGVYLENLSAPIVTRNNITTTQTGNSSYYGIYLNNCDGKNMITANYIYTSGSGEIGYGIDLNGSASTTGNNALLANNSIQISNTNSIAIGIDQSYNSMYYDIFSNTVYVSGGTSPSTYAYQSFTSSDDTKIKNNIFANFATGALPSSNLTVYIGNATGVSEASNNCYWTENTGNPFRAYYGGSSYSAITTYTAALGETNAVNIDPQMTFVSNVGWKATNPALTNMGLYLASIPFDIDLRTRLDPTTIGAHENGSPFAPANDDICNADSITFGVATPYSNIGATAQVNEPVPSISDCATGWCPADGAVQNSVWFTFTMSQNKRIRITTTGFDNQVTLYSASSCSTSFTFAAASDIAGAPGEISSICVSAGRCYIQIDGFQGVSGSGTVTITELTLDVPVATAPNHACTSFTANWNAVSGAITYALDVATDSAFTHFVANFNNFNAGNVTSYSIPGLTAGTTYYYRVRAYDGCVASTANSNIIAATTLDVPVAGFSATVNGFTATFVNSSVNALSYHWDFGNGSTSTDVNPVYPYSASGTYQVKLTALNSCGADTITQTVNVNCSGVNLSIGASGNTTFCEGDSVMLATIVNPGYHYQWLKNNQPISGAQSFHYNAKETGDYTLMATDINNCSGVSNVITVTANPHPAVTIMAANGDTTVCFGSTVELETATTGVSYQWLNNDQPISNATNSSYIAAVSGNYALSLTDANTCSAKSNTVMVTVKAGLNVSIQANGPTTFCADDEVQLTTAATGLFYQWLQEAQPISNANAGIYTATASGNYTLSVTDSIGCTAVTNTIAVTVNDLPAVALAEFDTACTTDAVFTLTGGSPVGGNYFIDGDSATVFDPSWGGDNYEIEYAYTDGNNCTESDTRDLIVEICGGMANVPTNSISVFPNPAFEYFTAKINDNLAANNIVAHVYDAAGKEVIIQTLINGVTNEVSLKNISKGLYLVKISADGRGLYETQLSVIR